MTELVLPVLLLLVASGVGVRLWLRRWRDERAAARRRVEAPNARCSSVGVRDQEDRDRWGSIEVRGLHPLNREEVARLLELLDADGIGALSLKDRLFLDNMTLRRLGT
ncbi:MAG: hypothetical protein OEN00_14855 [Gemmatimonadota bacterium]|nr:hypothetical protein [Gemmatimonadota bacterium]